MLHSVLAAGGFAEIHVHYLHGDDVTSAQREPLAQMIRSLGGEISFIAIDREVASRLPTTQDLPTSHWYRVFLPELLPDVDRIVYLDADTVVLESLAPLWETKLGDNCLAAVTNVFQEDHFHLPQRLGLADPSLYFNTGVMVLDLAAMRREGTTDQIVKWALANSERLAWPEQDVTNVVLAERRLELHPRWNCMHSVLRFPWAAYAFGYEAIEAARVKPAIRHFEGPLTNKPWHLLGDPGDRAVYMAHRSQTPWPDLRPEGATPRNRLRLLRRRLSA